MITIVVVLCSAVVGRDPFRLHSAMMWLGFDCTRSDVRDAIMAHARIS